MKLGKVVWDHNNEIFFHRLDDDLKLEESYLFLERFTDIQSENLFVILKEEMEFLE